MAYITPRMGLRVWNSQSDPYDHEQLADNFLKIDLHDHSDGHGQPVGTAGLQDGAVTGDKVYPASIGGDKLIPGSIDSGTIADSAVVTAGLANGAVTAAKLANRSVATSHLAWDLVTSLPSSPVDGDIIAYQPEPSGATPEVVWMLRYYSTLGWSFLGGASLHHAVATAQNTTTASFADLGTVGPVVTVPTAGSYAITMGMRVYDPNASAPFASAGPAEMALQISGTVDTTTTVYGNASIAGGSANMSVSRTIVRPLVAGTITAKYRTGGAGGAGPTAFAARFITITPVVLNG